MRQQSWIHKPLRLLPVDSFNEVVIEKCIGHIKFMNGPVMRVGEKDDSWDNHQLDHGIECLSEVNAFMLMKTLHHETSLVAF